MLYLEDYLEMIEHLPQELRDRFTEMREMDLSVQNRMDNLEKRARILFSQCKRNELQGQAADVEFQSLRKDYYKVLEDADEKVTLANQMHELVERYLRRLDSELYKFKCELEADNNGITDILEKRSLELDGNSTISNVGNQKENRYFGAISSSNHTQKDNRYRHKPEKRRDSNSGGASAEKRPAVSNNLPPPTTTPTAVRPTTPNIGHHSVIQSSPQTVPYSLHIGAGNAIAAAASQAIVATQQMQQGRRTASLKATYEAFHTLSGGGLSHDLIMGRELAGATHNAIQAVEREGNLQGQKRQKKKISNNISQGSSTSSTVTSTSSHNSQTPSNVVDSTSSRANDNGVAVEQTTEGEWPYDPNEPRYCICNQVSYGDMVACDNEACPFEWFHYPCVGITQSPKGKWYCPKCTASMRRRGNRKN